MVNKIKNFAIQIVPFNFKLHIMQWFENFLHHESLHFELTSWWYDQIGRSLRVYTLTYGTSDLAV